MDFKHTVNLVSKTKKYRKKKSNIDYKITLEPVDSKLNAKKLRCHMFEHSWFGILFILQWNFYILGYQIPGNNLGQSITGEN